MRTSRHRGRTLCKRAGVLALVPALGFALVAAATGPAGAASTQGSLRIYGPGTVYSGNYSSVSLAVAPGGTATYSVQVANLGTSASQFHLSVTSQATATLSAAGVVIGAPELAADGYFTPPIAAGKTETVSIKVTAPANAPIDGPGGTNPYYVTLIELFTADTNNYLLGEVVANTGIRAPKGTSPFDLYVHNLSQPEVGGAVQDAVETAPAISKVGASAKYTIVLENDSPAGDRKPISEVVALHDQDACTDFSIALVDGNRNITAAATAQTYLSPAIAPGATHTLTATVTYLGRGDHCSFADWDIATYDSAAHDYDSDTTMHANLAYNLDPSGGASPA